MKMRWVAPPNWPTMPEGFQPPSGWQPDESWPDPPAGWQFWQPVEADSVAAGKGAAVLVCVGGVLAALGPLGTWIHLGVSGYAGGLTSNGLSNGWDGWASLVGGVVAIVIAVCFLGDWQVPPLLAKTAIWPGGWALAWDIYQIVQVNHHVTHAKASSPLITGGVGYGLVIATIGAAAIVVGGVGMLGGQRGFAGVLDAMNLSDRPPTVRL